MAKQHKPRGRIVAGTGASASGGGNVARRSVREGQHPVEGAMTQAIAQAHEEGVSDPSEINKRMRRAAKDAR